MTFLATMLELVPPRTCHIEPFHRRMKGPAAVMASPEAVTHKSATAPGWDPRDIQLLPSQTETDEPALASNRPSGRKSRSTTVLWSPPPRGAQFVPFQHATWEAAIPPATVKNPPAKTLPLE